MVAEVGEAVIDLTPTSNPPKGGGEPDRELTSTNGPMNTDGAKAACAMAAGGPDEPFATPVAAKKPAAKKKTPPRPASTSSLINKMLAILTRRLDLMMKGAMKAGDKEIQLMASMTRTLDQLIEMKKAEKTSKAKPAQKRTTKELDELRRKIAERIDELYRD